VNKNPLVGGLLNVVIPGLAYGYIRKWGTAAVQFFVSLIVLVACLFIANLLESTNPPWPAGLAPAVAVILFYLWLFVGGITAVRRHNRSPGAAQARSQSSGNRTLVVILVGIILILCGLLVAVIAFSGVLDKDEPVAVSASLPPTSTLAAISGTAEATAKAEPTEAAEATPEETSTVEVTAEPTQEPTEETPSESMAVVANDTLNIRSGPGTSYPKVGTLQQGDEVTVTGRNKGGTWLAITTAAIRKGLWNSSLPNIK